MTDAPRYPKPEAVLQIPEYGHAIVEAAAGTGKTHTLEHLVVDLVLSQGIRMDQILVVTFTEKAASELERRLRARFAELLAFRETTTRLSPDQCWVLTEEARERLEAALADFDAATIGTIHAFAHRLVSENPFLGGCLFERELASARDLFRTAFRSALRDVLVTTEARKAFLRAWLQVRKSTVDGLETLLFRAAQARGGLGPEFDSDAIVSLLREAPDLDDLDRKLSSLVHRNSLGKVRRNLAHLRAAAASESLAFALAALDEADLVYLGEKVPPLSGWLEKLETTCVPFLVALTRELLPPVEERLRRIKRETGRYDFQDMLTLAAEALEGPQGGAVAQWIRERYRTALVDEFQDTDDIQWSIFKRVFFDAAGHHPLRLVGDPKQAIYSCRGADVVVYLEAKKAIASRGTVVPLAESYRASADLIDALNLIFDPKAAQPFFSGAVRYDRPLRAARPRLRLIDHESRPVPPVVLLRAEGEEARRLLVSGIADEVASLLSLPGAPGASNGSLRFGEEGSESPVGSRDVLILTRSHREAEEVGSVLRSRGVPCTLYKRGGLFRSREAEEVTALLEAIRAPLERGTQLFAFLTPFFDFRLGELTAAVDLPTDHPMLRRLFAWKALADERDYQALFTSILQDSGILRRQCFAHQGDRKKTNFVQIFETLLEDVQDRRMTLDELLSTLRSYRDDSGGDDGTGGRGLRAGADRDVLRVETEDAVRIMTIHMAKGSEATIVFLCALASTPRQDVHGYHHHSERRVFVGDRRRAPREVRAAIEREEREEEQRLFYVALTRARGRVYLPFLPDALAARSCYAPLHLRIQELLGVFSVQSIQPRSDSTRTELAAPGSSPLGSWRPPAELLDEVDVEGTFAALRVRHRGLSMTSYSRMKRLSGGYRAPIDEPSDLVEAIERGGALPGGASAGTCLHEMLASIPLDSVREEPSLEAWKERSDVRNVFQVALRRNGVDRRFRPEAERMVHAALSVPVPLGATRLEGGFTSVRRHAREVEFVLPLPAQSASGFVKGFIDLVFEHEGRIYLCDWKSDLLSEWSETALVEHVERNYRLQVELYSLAAVERLGCASEEDYLSRFGGFVFCFLRGLPEPGFHFERPTFPQILGWRDELARERRW